VSAVVRAGFTGHSINAWSAALSINRCSRVGPECLMTSPPVTLPVASTWNDRRVTPWTRARSAASGYSGLQLCGLSAGVTSSTAEVLDVASLGGIGLTSRPALAQTHRKAKEQATERGSESLDHAVFSLTNEIVYPALLSAGLQMTGSCRATRCYVGTAQVGSLSYNRISHSLSGKEYGNDNFPNSPTSQG